MTRRRKLCAGPGPAPARAAAHWRGAQALKPGPGGLNVTDSEGRPGSESGLRAQLHRDRLSVRHIGLATESYSIEFYFNGFEDILGK